MSTASQENFRWLIKGEAGCIFAAKLALRDKESKFGALDLPGTSLTATQKQILNATLRAAPQHHEAMALTFPDIKSPEQIVNLISELCSMQSWYCYEVPWLPGSAPDALLLGLRWILPDDKRVAFALGFANINTMPVTRRAPHTMLAFRVGLPGPAPPIGTRNPNEVTTRSLERGRMPVHLADMPTLLQNDQQIEKMWDQTQKFKQKKLQGQKLVEARAKVTFALPLKPRYRVFDTKP